MTLVKICGLISIDEVKKVIPFKPDFIGIVLTPKSKRFLSTKEAASMAHLAKEAHINPIGVFWEESLDEICEKSHECGLLGIQVHRPLEEKEWERLSDFIRIQAGTPKTLKRPKNFTALDYVLLDAPTHGEGKTLEWERLEKTRDFFFFGGGHTPKNPH